MKFHEKKENIFSFLDQQIGYLLLRKIYSSYAAFAEETSEICNYNKKIVNIPMHVSQTKRKKKKNVDM